MPDRWLNLIQITQGTIVHRENTRKNLSNWDKGADKLTSTSAVFPRFLRISGIDIIMLNPCLKGISLKVFQGVLSAIMGKKWKGCPNERGKVQRQMGR
jgi:energy-converting hydrogenase Eha subunit A